MGRDAEGPGRAYWERAGSRLVEMGLGLERIGDLVRVDVRLGEPDVLECYPGLLNQALMNLVANAIDAIDGDGSITISAGWDEDTYSIEVVDTGPGIPLDRSMAALSTFTRPNVAGPWPSFGYRETTERAE